MADVLFRQLIAPLEEFKDTLFCYETWLLQLEPSASSVSNSQRIQEVIFLVIFAVIFSSSFNATKIILHGSLSNKNINFTWEAHLDIEEHPL